MSRFRDKVMPGTPEFDELVTRMVFQESRGNPNAVNRSSGASGLAQIMPATARDPGFGIKPLDWNKRFDAKENLRFGRDYLGTMLNRYDGNVNKALAAYNWGPGHADRWSGSPDRLPAETRGYIANITQNRQFGQPTYGPTAYQGMRGIPQISTAAQNAGLSAILAEGEWLAEPIAGEAGAESVQSSWQGYTPESPAVGVQQGTEPASTAQQTAMEALQSLRSMAGNAPGPTGPSLQSTPRLPQMRSQIQAPKVQSGYRPLQPLGMQIGGNIVQ